jgi:hypothetical protein
MDDAFNYKREVKKAGEVITGDYATFSLGGTKIGLVASVQVAYQHDVNFTRELGSADAYLTSGNPMGNLSASRAVGPSGMFKTFKPAACGFIESASVTLNGKGNCANITTGAGVNIRNVIVRSIAFDASAGREITENVSAVFTYLGKS